MASIERRSAVSLGLELDRWQAWLAETGPLAIVDLETTGFPESRSAELIEVGVLLFEPGADDVGVLETRLRPRRPIPAPITRITGLRDADVADAPRLEAVRGAIRDALAGRVLVAHQADFERAFLRRDVDPALGSARYLDSQDVLALTHPDAPDLRLETFTRLLLDREERHRALADAIDTAGVLDRIAEGARAGERRYVEARRILGRHLPSAPWRGLLEPAPARTSDGTVDLRAWAGSGADDEADRFLEIGPSEEKPVPFAAEAIVAALSDAERGARHFPGYRVREEQLALAREFFHVFADGGIAKLEGGTGVGKSLAYLSAAIPFAMERAAAGAREPVVLSTRTKLLQDQLLRKDIAAAARFLGHPDLRALSIKGRANYVCERRLGSTLGEASDPALIEEWKADYAMLEACARIRPNGEVGTVPAALWRRHPKLRELLRSSVAARADQCSREQCAYEPRCPFGRHRRSLAKAHLVVANHDLLLRWPPDYPPFTHVVMDEGHEVGGVAEEVYALRVRPEDLVERLDELFGAPAPRRGARRTATAGLVATPAAKGEEKALRQGRRDLMLELVGLGRAMADAADAYGGVELGTDAAARFRDGARVAELAAGRLEALAGLARRAGPAPRRVAAEDALGRPTAPERDLDAEDEASRSIAAHAEALEQAAVALRTAFAPSSDEYVATFEGVESPYDRWSLVLRPVAPGEAFREAFLEKVDGLAIVSATLFVGEDDHAALGEVGLAGDGFPGSWRRAVGSPFPFEQAMRVVALEPGPDLVEQTAETLAVLARTLRGRTLGLFTSLARMRATADRLDALLAGEGIEILLPRRASDDPGALVERFRKARGGAVLLGARRFWQGIDVRGDDLQAVVIEKLPFDVPTELRRRRDERLRAAGEDPFARAAMGRMLLNLKQMAGRLIRSETDRGLVVIVDARPDRGYFRRLGEAFPAGVAIERLGPEGLPEVAEALGLLEPDIPRG